MLYITFRSVKYSTRTILWIILPFRVSIRIEGGEESFVRDQTFVDAKSACCSRAWGISCEIITCYARWLAIVYSVLFA